MSTRRCPNCGGLVGRDAQWCGQCWYRLNRPPPRLASSGPSATDREPATAGETAPAGPGVRATTEGIVWACPTCGTENPIESRSCAACGTLWNKLLEEIPTRPVVAPGTAAAYSLLFPGLGHAVAGQRADGLARAVVFAYGLATLVGTLVMRGEGPLGPILPLLLASLLGTLGLYVVSAADAARAARGEAPILTTRTLFYGAAVLMLLTAAILVFALLQVGRR